MLPPKCRTCSVGLLYLLRYSPEFGPIEQAWTKMKERFKAKAPRRLEALEAEFETVLGSITALNASG